MLPVGHFVCPSSSPPSLADGAILGAFSGITLRTAHVIPALATVDGSSPCLLSNHGLKTKNQHLLLMLVFLGV